MALDGNKVIENVAGKDNNINEVNVDEVNALNDLLEHGKVDKGNESKLGIDKKENINSNTIQKDILSKITKSKVFFQALSKGIKEDLKEESKKAYSKLLQILDGYGINAVDNLKGDKNIKSAKIDKTEQNKGTLKNEESNNEELKNLEFDESQEVRSVIKEIHAQLKGLKQDITGEYNKEIAVDDKFAFANDLSLDHALSGMSQSEEAYKNLMAGLPELDEKNLKNFQINKLGKSLYNQKITNFFQTKFGALGGGINNLKGAVAVKLNGKISFVRKGEVLKFDGKNNNFSWENKSTMKVGDAFGRNFAKQKNCPPGWKYAENDDGDLGIVKFDSTDNKNFLELGKEPLTYVLNGTTVKLKEEENGNYKPVVVNNPNGINNTNNSNIDNTNGRMPPMGNGYQKGLDALTNTMDKFMPYLTQLSLIFKKMFNADKRGKPDELNYQLATMEGRYLPTLDTSSRDFYNNSIKSYTSTLGDEGKKIRLDMLNILTNQDLKGKIDHIIKAGKFDENVVANLRTLEILPTLPITTEIKNNTDLKLNSVVFDPKKGLTIDGEKVSIDRKGKGTYEKEGKKYDVKVSKIGKNDFKIIITDPKTEEKPEEESETTEENESTETKIGDVKLEDEEIIFKNDEKETFIGTNKNVYVTKEGESNDIYGYDFKNNKKYELTLDSNDKVKEVGEPKELKDYNSFFDYKDGKVNEKVPSSAFTQSKELSTSFLSQLKNEKNINNNKKFIDSENSKAIAQNMLIGLKGKDKDNNILENFEEKDGEYPKITKISTTDDKDGKTEFSFKIGEKEAQIISLTKKDVEGLFKTENKTTQ